MSSPVVSVDSSLSRNFDPIDIAIVIGVVQTSSGSENIYRVLMATQKTVGMQQDLLRPFGRVIRNGEVGAQVAHKGTTLFGARGAHHETRSQGFGDLNGKAADAACSPLHQHRIAWLNSRELFQRKIGRGALHWQAGHDHVVRVIGESDSHDRLGHRELGVGALNHNRHHLTATQIRAYAGSSVHDLAVHADSADLRQRDAADARFLARAISSHSRASVWDNSLLSVFFLETIDATSRIENTLFSSEERMRRR